LASSGAVTTSAERFAGVTNSRLLRSQESWISLLVIGISFSKDCGDRMIALMRRISGEL
jgi:hypothetical protein